MKSRFRWAPTPSGPLHLGNVFSIILTWLDARLAAGEVLLRIDDLDSTRTRPEFVREIFDVIQALGLDWQLGPSSFEDFESKFSQGRFHSFYSAEFRRSQDRVPELFYACSCSRKDLPSGSIYPGTCRSRGLRLVDDGSVAWRVRSELLPESARSLGDVVLFRKERLFAYQWVSLQEDLRWQITDIHRGEDLRSSSDFQIGLARVLAESGLARYEAFALTRFIHHPLVWGGEKKLSKSEGAQAARRWLSDPQKIFGAFLKWIGWGDLPVPASSQELLQLYVSRKSNGFSPSFSSQFQISELME